MVVFSTALAYTPRKRNAIQYWTTVSFSVLLDSLLSWPKSLARLIKQRSNLTVLLCGDGMERLRRKRLREGGRVWAEALGCSQGGADRVPQDSVIDVEPPVSRRPWIHFSRRLREVF